MESLILYDLFKQYGIQDTLPKIQQYVDWNKLMNIAESPIILKKKQRPEYEEDYTIGINEIRELILQKYMSEIKKAYQFFKYWFHNYDVEKYEIHVCNNSWYRPSKGVNILVSVEIKYLNGIYGVNYCFECRQQFARKIITGNTDSSNSTESDDDSDYDDSDYDDIDDDQIS